MVTECMFQAQFEKHESELRELSNNIEALRRNFSELYELKFVLRHTEDFLIEVKPKCAIILFADA